MSRSDILDAARAALEPLPWVHALWEGGSASFGRADAWSDLDVGLGVENGRVEAGFTAFEGALASPVPSSGRARG